MRAVVVLALFASCYDVPRPECGFQCGAADECPDGYACLGDRCRLVTDHPFSCPDIEDPDIGDHTAPATQAVAPVQGETNVPLDAVVLVTFNEKVIGVEESTFGLSTDTGFVMGAVSVVSVGRAWRFTPDRPLQVNKIYEVVLGSAISDLSYNPLPETRWSFATIEDHAGPMLVASSPNDHDANASPFGNITLNFDEPVIGISSSSVVLKKNGVALPTTYMMTLPQIVLVVHDPLDGETAYTLDLTSDITDAVGNPFTPKTLSFTTRDITPPSIANRAPMPDATDVPIGTTIEVTFSEDVDVSQFSVVLSSSAGPIATTFAYDGSFTVTLTPTAPLDPATVYTVSFMMFLYDFAGNSATFPSYTFTTAP